MERLEDLLGKYSPKEPPEVLAAKRYIDEHFHTPASVAVQEKTLVITVQSAALASALRMRIPELQAACDTRKKILLRIG